MSKIKIDDIELYSLSECAKEFIPGSNKHVSDSFVKFLVDNDLLSKEEIKYRIRKHNVYNVKDILEDYMMGHYYTEPKKIKGEMKNGTLYFDSFMALVLTKLFVDYTKILEEETNHEYKITEGMLKERMLDVALEFYVPRIDD